MSDINFQKKAIKERAELLRINNSDGVYKWEKLKSIYVDYKSDSYKNIFSASGKGSLGGKFTVRRNKTISIYDAIKFRNSFFLITQIETEGLYSTVTAAEVNDCMCRYTERRFEKNELNRPVEIKGKELVFAACMLEKYTGFSNTDVSTEIKTQYTAITPKDIELDEGAVIECCIKDNNGIWSVEKEIYGIKGGFYTVTNVHRMNKYFNEYELLGRTDV